MATYLYRLAKFSYRRRRLVLGIWLLILVGLGGAAAALKGPSNDQFSIPGIESQRAIDILNEKFPSASADGGTAQVVFVAPSGERIDSGAPAAAVSEFASTVSALPHVASVTPTDQAPVSQDGGTTFLRITYDVQSSELKPADQDAVWSAVDTARESGLNVQAGGEALQAQEQSSSAEVIGILVGAIVLAITFGSLVAAGLPLLTAVIGVAVGMSGVLVISHWVQLSSTAPILALMLGLAVGIDYALFVVSRYRHELLSGRDGEEAIGRAGGTAGSAVVFAGLTVLIALCGLSVVGIPFLTVMGLAAAATVGMAVLIALTLLPALLGFSGNKVISMKIPFVRRRPDVDSEGDDSPVNMGTRWAQFVTKRKVPVFIAAIVTLGVIAIPFFSMQTSLPDDGTAAKGTSQRQAYDLLSEAFGPGFNGPLLVALTNDGSANFQASAEAVQAQLKSLDDVATVSPPVLNQAGDTALLTVVPASGPTTQQTQELVRSIRALEKGDLANDDVTLYVTGATAMQIDVTDKLNAALPIYIVVVVGLALVLLALVFRSIMVPIKAAVGFLLTLGATFGALVAIFQWGWLAGVFGVSTTSPIVSFLPIIIIAILFGLAMDYEVFLVSRMREEFVHGARPTDAVIGGFRHGARVVTAAAVIMIAVFSGFMLGDNAIIKSVGFSLAFGVAVDAFVVRMTIVPAFMAIVGKSAWWLPRWLDKVMPNVDVEGSKLLTQLGDAQPEADRELSRV